MKEECWFCNSLGITSYYFCSYNYQHIRSICNKCLKRGHRVTESNAALFTTLEEAQDHLIHIKMFGEEP